MNALRLTLAATLSATACGCALLSPEMQSAVQKDDAERVGALLDKGGDLNERMGSAKMTPLMLAAYKGSYKTAALLLERGADLNARTNGTSALSEACLAGDKRMVEFLLSHGAEVSPRELAWASGPDKDVILALLKRPNAAVPQKAEAQAAAASQPAVAAPAGVDEPSYRLGERPDDFALVVGIGQYMDGSSAPFAEQDAAAVRRHLVALGYPSRNVVLLAASQAGRAGLERYLEHWLPNNVTSNSRFVFYFAGRAAVDGRAASYLLPWDGDPGQLEATGYPLARLYEKVAALKARSCVLIIDGAEPDRSELGDCAALVGARDALPDEKHAALTYRLLKGLNGEAADRNGAVTLRGLSSYAREKLAARPPRLLTGGLGEADLRFR